MAKREARTRNLDPWDPEESSHDPRRKVAVVAGVGSYLSGALLPLPNAPEDAGAVAELLKSDYGFDRVTVLTASPSGAAIRKAIRATLEAADDSTRWLFYFAGHGQLRDDRGYLHPSDARPDAPSTWLELPELIAACLDSKAGETLLVLDACHAGQALVRPTELRDLLPRDRQARMRVRQVLCAGGPDQVVLDGGGGRHSVFTACLLEALRGWAGVHEPDGTVRFQPLLDFLQTEVERRLKALGFTSGQRAFGGNLVGSLKRSGFELAPRVPRVPPETMKWLSSENSNLRRQGLDQLVEDTRRVPELVATALDLARRHLPSPYRSDDDGSGPPPLEATLDELERCQAAGALAGIAAIAQANFRRVAESLRVDREIGALLRELALEDPSNYVRGRSRKGLRQVSPETQKELGTELLEIQSRGDRRSRRQVWEVLASIPGAVELLSPPLRVLARLTRARLWSGGAWRTATATRWRRWMLATPALAFLLFYTGLASRYYLSTSGSTVVVRTGHPGFEAWPLIGLPLVTTEYDYRRLDDPDLALDERLRGSWLHLSDGAFAWDELLARHLEPVPAALSLWRAGRREPALARLAAAVERRDPAAIKLAAYVGFQSDEALPTVIDLLVSALARVDDDARSTRRLGEADPHEPALEALGVLGEVRPEAARRHAEKLIDRLESASEVEEAALVEALEALSRNDPGWHGSSLRRPAAKRLAARLQTAGAKDLTGIARAVRSLISLDPSLLADLLPDVCDALRREDGGGKLVLLEALAVPSPLSAPDLEHAARAVAQVVVEADEAAQQSAAIRTLNALARRSPKLAPIVVDPLSKAAADAESEVRLVAAEALLALSPRHVGPRRVAELLVELIGEDVPTSVHASAVRLLGGIRDQSARPAVVAALLDAAADWSSFVRQEALYQLIEMGLYRALDAASLEPVLRSALDDPSPQVQREAAQGFLLLADRLPGDVDPAIDLLVRALESDDWLEARNAAAVAQRFARASPAALERLKGRIEVHARQGDDPYAFRPIFEFLKQVGRSRPAALPELALLAADLLEGDRDPPSSDAIDLLWSLHELPAKDRAAALDALFARLVAGTAGQRAAAAVAIGYLAPGDERLTGTALTRLVPLLTEPEPEVRAAAGRALSALGEAQGSSPTLVEALLGGLGQEEPEVRRVCAKALARIPATIELSDMTMTPLLESLADAEPEVRRHAARALSRWGRGGPEILLEPLARRLEAEPVAEVRFEVAAAMGALGGDDPRIADRVIAVVEENLAATSDGALRVRAARLLGPMGERHPSTVERIAGALLPLLASPEYGPRQAALLTLRDIGMSDPRSGVLVLKVLEPLMFDPAWPGRWHGIANAIQPIVRTFPQLSGRAARLLRRFLRQRFRDRLEEQIAKTATDALIEGVTLSAVRRPDSLWPWLTAAGSFERWVGREAVARLTDEDPGRIPALRARLATYRRDLRPHVRQSAAQAEEMIEILERNRRAMAAGSRLERWREVLDWLPAQAGVRSAVNLALDRLEPGTRHL